MADALKNEPLILHHKEQIPRIFERLFITCLKYGFKPNIVSETGSLESALLQVDSGIGIAFSPECMKKYGSNKICFIDINGYENEHEIVSVWKKTNKNPTIPYFLQLIDDNMPLNDVYLTDKTLPIV